MKQIVCHAAEEPRGTTGDGFGSGSDSEEVLQPLLLAPFLMATSSRSHFLTTTVFIHHHFCSPRGMEH
jgi:hypothetical protein